MTKAELNDHLLAIAAGDCEAFTKVYRAYYRPVYLLAASIAQEPTLAEDIAQEVFIAICRCAGQYRAGGQPRAWIFGITKNHFPVSCTAAAERIAYGSSKHTNRAHQDGRIWEMHDKYGERLFGEHCGRPGTGKTERYGISCHGSACVRWTKIIRNSVF